MKPNSASAAHYTSTPVRMLLCFVRCARYQLRVFMQSRVLLMLHCWAYVSCLPAAHADSMTDYLDADGNEPSELFVESGAGGIIRAESKIRTTRELAHTAHVHSLYETRYVTEGRDNLEDSGIVSATSDIIFNDDLTFVPWVAVSREAEYAELNLNLLYVIETDGPFDLYAAYNHILTEQRDTDFNDNEIELGITYMGLQSLDLIASTYYSFEADGAFIEITAYNEPFVSSVTSIRAFAVLGWNAGYISDGHNGLNHLQLKAEISYFYTKDSEFTAFTAYNIPINRDAARYTGDASLNKFFWSGIGLSYYFR
jgi:hypothetical protein